MKPEFTIRPLRITDYDRINIVWQRIFPGNADISDSSSYLTEFLDRNPDLSFVAESASQVVGAVLAGHDNRRGFVYHLGVLPEFRRFGIGTALLEAVEAVLQQLNIVKLHLFVFQDNHSARNFYQQHGYHFRDDLVVYSKQIGKIVSNQPALETIGEMDPGEAERVTAMIEQVFDEFIGPGYAAEGVRTFKSFIGSGEFVKRAVNGNFVLVAKDGGGQIIGVIEMKDNEHISLLFVKKDYQRQGIAKHLWQQAMARCRTAAPEVTEFTVNSSPFAVPVYMKLGFVAAGPEQVRDGIRFLPMKMHMNAQY